MFSLICLFESRGKQRYSTGGASRIIDLICIILILTYLAHLHFIIFLSNYIVVSRVTLPKKVIY